MVKVPVKRKQKQKQKQKVIQKTKVSQNVKVVIGEVKRKQVKRKASGSKAGASAKPPIVLNISNPQPLNNAFMEYFKKQLQNQEPIKGTTLAQHEKINAREENKASIAGALHNLDMEPIHVARKLKMQEFEERKIHAKINEEVNKRNIEMQKSLTQIPKETKKPPKLPNPQANPPLYSLTPSSEETQSSVVRNLQEQQEEYESLMTPNPFEALEEEDTRVAFPSEMELEKRREMNRQDASEKRREFNIERAGEGAGAEAPKRKGRGPNKTAEQLQTEAEEKIKKAEEKKQKDEERKRKAEQSEAKRLQKQEQQKSKKDRRR